MLCTKPPPKRVETPSALRCSSRITVSEPPVFGVSVCTSPRPPKSCVTSSCVPPPLSPAPSPQPVAAAALSATATTAARRWARGLRNGEHHAVAAPGERAVGVARPVDDLQVEHIAAAAQARGQQVAPVAAVADREPRPAQGAALLHGLERLAPAVERRAAAAVVARQ